MANSEQTQTLVLKWESQEKGIGKLKREQEASHQNLKDLLKQH